MSLVETARLLGLRQLDLSRLLRGDFRGYSLVRLLHLLTSLGRDIDIVIGQPRSPSEGKLRVVVELAWSPSSAVERGAEAADRGGDP
jgi:transcriptional regulator with XRE-family HTH domain